jgi:hypothetical protein
MLGAAAGVALFGGVTWGGMFRATAGVVVLGTGADAALCRTVTIAIGTGPSTRAVASAIRTGTGTIAGAIGT